MGIADIVVILIVAAAVVLAAVRLVGTATGKRDCCSGDLKQPAGRDAAAFADAGVVDTDPANYPHAAELSVGGMSCERCAASVKNALESIDGNWAEVTLAGGRVVLRAKAPIDEGALKDVVERAGYRLVSCSVSR